MITVRFATGFSIQYNDAGYVFRSTVYCDLYVKEGGRWIAQVPNDALIELVAPCRIYNSATEDSSAPLRAELALLAKEVRSLKRKMDKEK